MREKYYSLIEELIRKHRKFTGLEAILDDIIEDVFQHSEVVIGNISNETVIQSYLEKVVSTSIITVPKKLDFHPEISHRIISTSPVINDIVHKSVNNELVDKMINGSFSKAEEQEEALTYETLNESVEIIDMHDSEPEIIENTYEENSLESFIVEEDESILANDDSDSVEYLDVDVASELDVSNSNDFVDESSFDENASDKVSENIYLSSESTLIVEEQVPDEELVEDNSDFQESDADDYISMIPDENEEAEVVLETSDSVLEGSTNESSEEEEMVSIDSFVEEIDNSSFEDLSNAAIVLEEEQGQDDDIAEIVSLDSQLEIEQNDSIIPEVLDEFVSEISEEDCLIEESQEQEDSSEIEDEQQADFAELFEEPNYDLFCYEKNENNINEQDIKEIQYGLVDLNKKRPELNIVKIFELKYKENSSVSQIALSLEMSEENVLEALNEIVALV